jgi:MFS family permease
MQRRVLFFVFVTVFLDMIGFGIVIPLLPFYVQSMGGTPEVVGLILTSFSVTQMLATPILGRLSDRRGRRPVILLSLAGNALAMLVFALATEQRALALLFLSRILAGGTAGNLAACQAAVADVTDGAERAAGMGRIGSGIGLGMVVGPVLGGALSHVHPAAPLLAAAALATADLVAAYFLMPETHAVAARSAAAAAAAPRALARALADPPILGVMAIYFLTFLCMTALQVSLPLLAQARLDWSATDLGRVFGLYGLVALVVQGGVVGWWSRRFGPVNGLLAGALAIGAGMAAIGGAYHGALLLFGVAATGLGVGLTNPMLATLASQHAGAGQQGAVLGAAQSAGGLARAVGPVWSGVLYQRVGPSAPFLSGVVAAGVSLAVALALKRRVSR